MPKKLEFAQREKHYEVSYLDSQHGQLGMTAINHAVQRLQWKNSRVPSVGEVAEFFTPGVFNDRDNVELLESEDFDEASEEGIDIDLSEGPEISGSTQPLFASPRDSKSRSTWNLRAPELEQGVNKLFIQLCRMPTDAEVAKELLLSQAAYQDMFGLLHSLRTASIDGQDLTTEVQAMPWTRDARDAAIFQCVRNGLMDLVKGAIQDVPTLECLNLYLKYSDCGQGNRDIYIDLERRDPELHTICAKAKLHLWIGVFDAQRDREMGGPIFRQRATGLDRRTKHVYLRGSQRGWLSSRKIWERMGKEATWVREFKTSYSFDDSGIPETLAEFRRKEKYELSLES